MSAWTSLDDCCSAEVHFNCLGPYNKDMADVVAKPMRLVNIGLIFVGSILDIVAFKKRIIGHWIIYFECFAQIVICFIPNANFFHMTEN